MHAPESLIGTVLAGRYRIESALGAGGMGAVFRARRVKEGDVVAVKVLPPGDDRSSLLPRFLREARLAARVRHPHVVRIHESGRWGDERDRYFLAMELVDGIGLDQLLDAGFDTGTCVALADQILDALGHVHARGILHRDIKPENVVVERDREGLLRAKVLDFGIAAAFEDEEATRLTQEGASIGTPAYMAPEQAEGKTLEGPVTDLYPVGVILYRMLSGRMPFEGGLTKMILAKIQSEPPRLSARAGLSIEDPLIDVVAKLVRRQPEERYQMAPDVRAALAPWVGEARVDVETWNTLGGGTRAEEGRTTQPSGHDDDTLLPGDTQLPVESATTAERDQLWGRDAERERIEALAKKVESGEGHVALVSGSAGLGKTALLKQVGIEVLEQGRFWLLHTGYDRGGGRQAGVRSALEGFLGTTHESRAGVERAVAEFLRRFGEDDPDEVAEIVEFLRPRSVEPHAALSADRRERRFAVFVRVLRRMARTRPVMLMLDDLDAGGADAGAFISFVLFEVGFEAFPLFVVASYRDLRDPIFAKAIGQSERYEATTRHTLQLGPIDEESMVAWLGRAHGLEGGVARMVAARASGNPLFAEHLAAAGELALGPAGGDTILATAGTNATQGEVPAPLRSLLERSLEERLSGSENPGALREVLQHLAVLGLRARASLLEASLGDEAADDLDDALDELIELEVLEEVAARDDVVGFVQGLMRDVVLSGLSGRKLRRMHKHAAKVRAEAPTADADAGAIGDHLEAAGEIDDAVSWWRRSVDRQIADGEAMAGAAWGMKAHAAMRSDDPERAQLGIRLGRLLLDMGELDGGESLLVPMLQSADADHAMLAGVVLADLRENRGAGAAFDELVQTMEGRLAEASPHGQGAFHTVKALAINYQGKYPEAFVHAEKAVELLEPGEVKERAKLRLAMVHGLLGRTSVGIEIAREVVASAAEDSDVLARGLRSLGFLLFQGWHVDEAKTIHQRALELARRTGRAARVPVALHDLAACYAATDEFDESREACADSIRAAEELGLVNVVVFCELKLLAFELLEGRPEGTLTRYEEIGERAHAAGMFMLDTLAPPVRGWARALSGDYVAAEKDLEGIIELNAYPRIFEVGQIFEGTAEALFEITKSGAHDYRRIGRVFYEKSAQLWQAVGAPERVAHCEARLEQWS